MDLKGSRRFESYIFRKTAPVVELVDTLDLGSSANRFESSSLSGSTMYQMCNENFDERKLKLGGFESQVTIPNLVGAE